ncbi:hypothetical protein GCM10010965_06650 [Caldalkalibacillus thermarum]|nr:hypothetical protein GCM10010965_06650 [Caldalkalibacillus thermarum]
MLIEALYRPVPCLSFKMWRFGNTRYQTTEGEEQGMRRKLKETMSQQAMARRMGVDFRDQLDKETTIQDMEIAREFNQRVIQIRQAKRL